MKKEYWLNLQQEILEGRGYYKLYVVILLIVNTIILSPDIPILSYFPRLAIAMVGLILLTIVYFVGKSERTKKQSQTICIYWVILFVATASALFWMFQ